LDVVPVPDVEVGEGVGVAVPETGGTLVVPPPPPPQPAINDEMASRAIGRCDRRNDSIRS
jgi:hypothetical protein